MTAANSEKVRDFHNEEATSKITYSTMLKMISPKLADFCQWYWRDEGQVRFRYFYTSSDGSPDRISLSGEDKGTYYSQAGLRLGTLIDRLRSDGHDPLVVWQEFMRCLDAPAAGSFADAISGRLDPIWFEDIQPPTKSAALVKGVLDECGMSVLYGESGAGKTFFTLDLALHIALGWEWRGHKVRQGGVIYIAAEGQNGIRKRIEAFRQQHDLKNAAPPFALIPTGVDLLNPDADTTPLIMKVKEAAERFPIKLVVIDTLARAMAGGNENASDAMGAFIRNVDRIRQETGAHVLIVHHSGKDAAKGARGHSSLRAATDTEIELTSDGDTGIKTACIKKQKDGEEGIQFVFRLDGLIIGKDEDGDPIRSCVVHHEEAGACGSTKSKKGKPPSPEQQAALDILRNIMIEKGRSVTHNAIPRGVTAVTLDEWGEAARRGELVAEGGVGRSAWFRTRAALRGKHLIGMQDGYVWLVT
jgi:KaiC/GvpD/RAD55 family RecA-like ATPase